MKLLRFFALLILMIGAGLTARAAYLRAKGGWAGVLIRRAWEKGLQTGKPQRPWSWADAFPIARLRIPRLGYDEIVLEAATPRTLAFGPARLLVELAWENQETWYLQAIAPVGSSLCNRSRKATRLISNGLIRDRAYYVSESIL